MVGVGNIISVGGAGGGSGGGSLSGITSINGQTGPSIIIDGANGVSIVTGTNTITVSAASLSGTLPNKFAADFVGITSGQFQHNLGTRDVVVQVYDDSSPPREILYDNLILDTLDAVSLLFNRPQNGRIVIIG